jgi:hypothetical protein
VSGKGLPETVRFLSQIGRLVDAILIDIVGELQNGQIGVVLYPCEAVNRQFVHTVDRRSWRTLVHHAPSLVDRPTKLDPVTQQDNKVLAQSVLFFAHAGQLFRSFLEADHLLGLEHAQTITHNFRGQVKGFAVVRPHHGKVIQIVKGRFARFGSRVFETSLPTETLGFVEGHFFYLAFGNIEPQRHGASSRVAVGTKGEFQDRHVLGTFVDVLPLQNGLDTFLIARANDAEMALLENHAQFAVNNVLGPILVAKAGWSPHGQGNLQLDGRRECGRIWFGPFAVVNPRAVVLVLLVVAVAAAIAILTRGRRRAAVPLVTGCIERRTKLVHVSHALVELVPGIDEGQELFPKGRAAMNLVLQFLIEGVDVDVGRAGIALRFRVRQPRIVFTLEAGVVNARAPFAKRTVWDNTTGKAESVCERAISGRLCQKERVVNDKRKSRRIATAFLYQNATPHMHTHTCTYQDPVATHVQQGRVR